MSMTKREQTELTVTREALTAARALGWPREPKPEPMDLDQYLNGLNLARISERIVTGWHASTFNDEFRVSEGCSSGGTHSKTDTTKTTTQGGGRFFRTRREALLTCRWELCERFAKVLAELDAEIDRERQEP